jgi:flagellar hook-length control protein FliK
VSSGKAAASSGGFAGVLVAAIGGEAAAGTGSGALTAPSAAALLPGLLTEPAGEAEQDGQMGDRLLAALNKLLGQLRPLVQEDKTDGTSGQQGELADLLAVIQALFLQLQASRSAAAEPGAADGTALAQTGETALSSLPADMLANLFRQTKQLSEALSQGSVPSSDASALAEGLKMASAALADNGEARAAASEGPKAGVQTAAEGLADIRQQPAGQETGRKVAAFREPILMWNWAAEANDARPDATGPQADGISERPQPEGGHAPLAVPAMNASAVPSLETAARTGVPAQVPVQQFSREIGGFLVKQFVLHNGNGLTEARISLHPEHLGHVDVRIVMQEGQMTAQFVASQGSVPSSDASALAEGLKMASAALADNGEARAAASEGPKAGVQTAAEGLADIRQQPAGQETGRKVAAFREPILMWNWAAEANDARPDATGPQADGISERPQPEGGHAPLAVPAMNASAVPSLETAARTGVPAQVPVQQFSREIGGFLVKQFVLHNGNGLTEARISLHPEHLGHVDVRIVMQEGQMTAQFVAQNGTAKELIENQLNTLRAALQNQGIQVERIEVVQHSELQDTASFSEQERRHSGSGREEQYSSRTGRDSSLEEIGDFEDELARSNGLKEIGYGSSLNVIA